MNSTPPIAHEAERVHALQAATAALGRAATPLEVAEAALSQALPIMDAAAGLIALLSADGTELHPLLNQGFDEELRESWRCFPGDCPHPILEAVRLGVSVWVPSPAAFAAHYAEPLPSGLRYHAWAAIPLRIDGGGLGVLGLGFSTPQAFEAEDQDVLTTLAGLCAQALSRARLIEATLRAADRLARLQSLTGVLAQAVSVTQVAEAILNQVSPNIGSSACSIWSLAHDGGRLELIASRGLTPALKTLVEQVPLSGANPVAEVLRTGAPLWLPSNEAVQARYPDLAEQRAAAGFEALAAIPLIVRDGPVGVVLLSDQTAHAFQAEDRAYLLALTHQCAQALDRARLYASLEQRVQERTAALEREIAERRRVEAQLRDFSAYLNQTLEDERSRISRQVHDELGGALTGMKMVVRRLQKELPATVPGGERLEWLSSYMDEVVDVVRRIASDLRPSILDDLGLVAALDWQLQQFEKQSGLKGRLNVPEGVAPIPAAIGTAVFRIVKESLTNILRHAQASAVTVTVREAEASLLVTVTDDGRGLPPEQLARSKSLGLMGMRERAKLVGGELEIQSQPGEGTSVHIRVPLPPGE